MSEIVRLNVGGVIYTTTLATLCKYPDSMLGAMFSGNYGMTTDENGCFFIDRDGTMFRHILAFLRSNTLILPKKFKEFDLLKNEADFYQITPLLDALNEYGREGKKCLEIMEKIILNDFRDCPHSYTYVMGRKDVLSELPDYFGLEIENAESYVVNVPHEIQLALSCKSRWSFYEGISLRLSFASYLYQRGWTLTWSKSSSAGSDKVPMQIIHERWTHES